MKNSCLRLFILSIAPLGCAPVWAQPEPLVARFVPAPPLVNGLPFRLVAPTQAEKLAMLSPIRINIRNATVATALEELQTQSGISFNLEEVRYSKKTLAKRANFAIETSSFNAAFDAIMSAAKLKARLSRYSDDELWRVDFDPQSGAEGLPNRQGLFGLRLMRLNTTLFKSADLSDAQSPQRRENNRLVASLKPMPDARLPVIGAPRPRLTRAEDEQGRSWLKDEKQPDDGDNWRYKSGSFYSVDPRNIDFDMLMKVPAADAKMLRHLEGILVYSLLAKSESWEVPDLLAQNEWNHTFKSERREFYLTVTPELTTKSESANLLTVNFEVTSNERAQEGEVPPPMLALKVLSKSVKVFDASGAALMASVASSRVDASMVKMTLRIRNAEPSYSGNSKKALELPLKLIFEAPLEVVQTEVPWAFENVPLP